MTRINNFWFERVFNVNLKKGDRVYQVVRGKDAIDFTKPIYESGLSLYIIIDSEGERQI